MEVVFAAIGLLAGVLGAWGISKIRSRRRLAARQALREDPTYIPRLLQWHLQFQGIDEIEIAERRFPFRVRSDLQQALDRLFVDPIQMIKTIGIRVDSSYGSAKLSKCLETSYHGSISYAPAEYEEIDIGEERPVRVLKSCLWLLKQDELRLAVLLVPTRECGYSSSISIQIASSRSPDSRALVERLFKDLEEAVSRGESYRGKVLSLDAREHSYSGQASAITVHKLHPVSRDELILPASTLELLERNVLRFVEQRSQLARYRQSTRKGLLFYGPPGTGKTHTIHYLTQTLRGHTTLIITAEQVGWLSEYMTLARLLQPSVVVVEDVDLIARDRESMQGPWEEALLNKLLNEMDGLKESADILFILTTNRPEALEAALAARPGRVDQAIEFPPPDAEGRGKLIRLYNPEIPLSDALIETIVQRTDGVSAAFIKELVRRMIQSCLQRGGSGEITGDDADRALDEMLFSGCQLNRKLLGARVDERCCPVSV